MTATLLSILPWVGLEWRCRSICVEDYGFKYNEYVCQ